jgi:hypothetical protein
MEASGCLEAVAFLQHFRSCVAASQDDLFSAHETVFETEVSKKAA